MASIMRHIEPLPIAAPDLTARPPHPLAAADVAGRPSRTQTARAVLPPARHAPDRPPLPAGFASAARAIPANRLPPGDTLNRVAAASLPAVHADRAGHTALFAAATQDDAALAAEITRLRAEAEQVIAEKNHIIEARRAAYNALVEPHNALVARYQALAEQARAAEAAAQPQLQALDAQLQALIARLDTLADAMNNRFAAAHAAISALQAFDQAVQAGTEPDAAEHARLYAEYAGRYEAVDAQLTDAIARRDDLIDERKGFLADANADLDRRLERLNSRIGDAEAAWNTYVKLATRYNDLLDARQAAVAAVDLFRASALTDQLDALEPDVNSAKEHFDTIMRDVNGYKEDYRNADAAAAARLKEFDSEIKNFDDQARDLDAELGRINATYTPRLDALKAQIDQRNAELVGQVTAATQAIEGEYGPQAGRLAELLSALYATGDARAALAAITAIPDHAAAPGLADAATILTGWQLLLNQAALIRNPVDALIAQANALEAEVAASAETLAQRKAELDALVAERDTYIRQKQAEIDALLAAAPPPALAVQPRADHACPNAEWIIDALAPPAATGLTWTSRGAPPSGTGLTYRTRFTGLARQEPVELLWDHFTGPIRLRFTVPVWEESGPQWHARFAGSVSIDDLTPAFGANVRRFKAALEAAGATVKIDATYRPMQRSYLMHYAWRIALPAGHRDRIAPDAVPQFHQAMLDPGAEETGMVEICWLHHDGAGRPDVAASVAAAQKLAQAYPIKHAPAYPGSKHYLRQAIDMAIEWKTTELKIKDAQGREVTISGAPADGTNPALAAVGATYGVIKLVGDPPHWHVG